MIFVWQRARFLSTYDSVDVSSSNAGQCRASLRPKGRIELLIVFLVCLLVRCWAQRMKQVMLKKRTQPSARSSHSSRHRCQSRSTSSSNLTRPPLQSWLRPLRYRTTLKWVLLITCTAAYIANKQCFDNHGVRSEGRVLEFLSFTFPA